MERPPQGFAITPHFIPRGIALIPFDVWVALTIYLGDIALEPWNDPVRFMSHTRASRVGFNMIGNNRRQDPPLLNKHVLWSLSMLVGWSDSQQHYAETTYEPRISGAKLGIGRVYAKAVSSTTLSNGAAEPLESVDNSIQKQDKELVAHLPQHPKPGAGDEASTVSRRAAPNEVAVAVRVTFFQQAKLVCQPVVFYFLLMNFLIVVAEKDADDTYTASRMYDRESDFTFEIGATSAEAALEGRLKVRMVIGALQVLAEFMSTQVEPSERFHEFAATFKWNGSVVGRIIMFKGRTRPGA